MTRIAMATQTVTINRIPCSTTVRDVIWSVLGSDVPDLDQHVLFYVYGKREKRIKSTTHLHRLLARSKHRVHFVVKKRLKPKCESSFGIKAKLLLQNMKSLFNEDSRNETVDDKDRFPALNAECKRRRLSGETDNLYQPDFFRYNKYGERDSSHLGRLNELDTLQNEFETRYADIDDNESFHTGLQKDNETEDQSNSYNHFRDSADQGRERMDSLQHEMDRGCMRTHNVILKRTSFKTIHPSKLYGVVTSGSEKVPTKHERQIGMKRTKRVKVNTCKKQLDMKRRKLDTTDQHKEFSGEEGTNYEHSITASDLSGDYVLLNGHAGIFTTHDDIVDEWDSAFEDDNDVSV